MNATTANRQTSGRSASSVKPPTARTLEKLQPADREILEGVLAEPPEYVSNPLFSKRNAEKVLYPDETECKQSVDAMLDKPNAVKSAMSTLSADEEQLAFQRFNYARYRVCRLLKKHAGKRLSLSGARDVIFWQRRTLCARSFIVQANLPLVLAMAKRTRLNGIDYNELISEGNMALLRSVSKFDCSRGFKFSTYACRAILKSFSRVAMRTTRYRGRFPTEFDPSLEKSDYLETKREEEHGDCVEELRGVLSNNLAELSDIEWTVIKSRFAIGSSGETKSEPKTLEQVGSIIGVTKERVRQIQNKALRKLRVALEESIAAA